MQIYVIIEEFTSNLKVLLKLMSNTPQQHTPIITIDGTSGVGKGTLTSKLAIALNYQMLDSGSLYRIVGLFAHQNQLLTANLTQEELENRLETLTNSLTIQFSQATNENEHIQIVVNGQDVSQIIRTEQVGEYASKIAIFAKVRNALLNLQRNMATPQGLVADGRDMGTVIFPQADLKIYLTASAQKRAERRVKQLQNAGKSADFDEILKQIIARDERDSNRSVAPLKPAADAVVIDTSDIDAKAVFAQVWQLCQERNLT